eukprot:g50136.t1
MSSQPVATQQTHTTCTPFGASKANELGSKLTRPAHPGAKQAHNLRIFFARRLVCTMFINMSWSANVSSGGIYIPSNDDVSKQCFTGPSMMKDGYMLSVACAGSFGTPVGNPECYRK